MLNFLKNFVRDESGMEMIEWTIVAIIFALAAATAWGEMEEAVADALERIGDEMNNTSSGS